MWLIKQQIERVYNSERNGVRLYIFIRFVFRVKCAAKYEQPEILQAPFIKCAEFDQKCAVFGVKCAHTGYSNPVNLSCHQ